jgi:hypothetical protein
MSRLVPFGDIHLEHKNWKNPRTITGLSDKDLDELAADIKSVRDQDEDKSGIIDAPKVVMVKDVNDTFITLALDGQRRLLAGKRVPIPKNMMIEVIDLEDEPIDLTPEKGDELMLKALRMFNREPLSSFELTEVAKDMRSRKRQLSEIADAIHKSESWVSRFLKAIDTATPKLVHAWKKGEITDEQFKDLAAQKDAAAQDKSTDTVVDARKSGDKVSARTAAKEIAETAKQKKARAKAEKLEKIKAAKEAKAQALAAKKQAKLDKKNGVKQGDSNGTKSAAVAAARMDKDPDAFWTPPAEPTKPKKPTAPNRVVLEEIVHLADKRPPTHDYVKGVLDGTRHALGLIDQTGFAKAWSAWIAHVGGTASAEREKLKGLAKTFTGKKKPPAKRTYAAVRAGKKEKRKILAKVSRATKAKKKARKK